MVCFKIKDAEFRFHLVILLSDEKCEEIIKNERKNRKLYGTKGVRSFLGMVLAGLV